MILRLCSATLVLMTLCSQAEECRTDDWAGWRGGRGDGIQHGANPPVQWGPTENVAWKTEIEGIGRSSPIVMNDRIYLTTGVEADQSRRVICADLQSGQVLWNTVVHQGPGGQMHRDNTMASSTPTTDGTHVFAAFVDDQGMTVVALNQSGEVVWKQQPGTYYSNHGFAASPVLYGDGVIVNGHQDGKAFVVMLSKSTGEELWRYTPAVSLRSFSTPVLTRYEDRDQLILTGASQTIGLDPSSGVLIWSVAGPSDKFVCTPSVGHNMVFSFAGSPDKKALAVKLGGHGDISESHVAWRLDRGMPYVPTPLLHGDYLHVVNDVGVYLCLDAVTGKIVHTARALGSVYSSPVAVDDRIYFFEDSGRCTVIENSSQFKVLARNELGEETYCTPAIVDDSLIVRTQSSLIRIADQSKSRRETAATDSAQKDSE